MYSLVYWSILIICTHWYCREFESVLQNDLSKVAVVQDQVGGVPVQPVDETARSRHDVCRHVNLGQFHDSGGGLGTGPGRRRRPLVGGVEGRDELGGLLGESAD